MHAGVISTGRHCQERVERNKTRFVDTRKALGALNRKIGVDFRAKGGKKLFQQMRL